MDWAELRGDPCRHRSTPNQSDFSLAGTCCGEAGSVMPCLVCTCGQHQWSWCTACTPKLLGHQHCLHTNTACTPTLLAHQHCLHINTSCTPTLLAHQHCLHTKTAWTPTLLAHQHCLHINTACTPTLLAHPHCSRTHCLTPLILLAHHHILQVCLWYEPCCGNHTATNYALACLRQLSTGAHNKQQWMARMIPVVPVARGRGAARCGQHAWSPSQPSPLH